MTTILSAVRTVESRWAIRRPVPQQLPKTPLNQHLGVGVHVRGRFVQHQYPGVCSQGSREADQLPLTQAQVPATLLELRIVAPRQPLDEFVRSDDPRRTLYILVCHLIVAVSDVLPDGPGEEHRLLHHDAGLVHQRVALDVSDIVSVDEDPSGRSFVEPEQQRHERGLARACRTDDRDGLSGLYGQIYVLEHRGGGLVFEAYALEADLSLDGRHADRSRRV